MKKAISQCFSVSASKEPKSVDHIENFYLTETYGTTPSVNDSRWQYVKEGDQVPVPTSLEPYLWKKVVTYFTDKTTTSAVEFAGKFGTNGIAFVVDIDNEMDGIPCDYNGYLSSARTFCLNISAFYDLVDISNSISCSCSVDSIHSGISVNTNTAKSPIVTFAAGTYSGTYVFTFTVSHSTYGTRKVVFTVAVQKAGSPGASPAIYNLVPSHTSLSFARDTNGNLTGSYSVTCQVSRTVGGSTSIVAPSNYSTYGLTIKYGWDETDPCSTGYSAVSVGTSEAAAHTNLIFELYSGSTRIDRETIPIIKDGSKGGTGDPGNGIASVSFARMFTMAFSAPAYNNGSWIESTSSSYPSESGLSKENRYLWQRKTTTYTNTSVATTYEVSLLAQFESGVCANLLEDTAFNDINDMDAWTVKVGSVIPNVFENQNVFSFSPNSNTYYTDLLEQIVYKYGTLTKLEADTWYTFSFYGKMGNGRLHTYLYRNDNGNAVQCSSSVPWLVDGKAIYGATNLNGGASAGVSGTFAYFSGDGHMLWQLGSTMTRHSVTFKTGSSLASGVEYRVLFRTDDNVNGGYISMPKLERNTIATEWIEHSNDRMAADFQHIYAGVWSASTAYIYANGVRHVVRAKKSANGEMTYFRLKKRTSSSGYKNSSEPYSDTRYWEEASYLKFVATDLMLADEVITDKLTVSKIRGAGGKFILDKDGNVTGINCKFINSSVSGYFHKEKVTITSANWSSYITSYESGQIIFDFEKTGSWIEFKYLPDNGVIVTLPFITSNSESDEFAEQARSLVGQNVLLHNRSGKSLNILIPLKSYSNVASSQLILNSGCFVSLDCTIEANESGYETVYWKYRTGKNRY